MIHENNTAPAEGIPEEKIAEFEEHYDAIVKTAAKEYEDTPPSDYYREGYNLYLRMAKYKHNHLLFLSNPLVEPDNNNKYYLPKLSEAAVLLSEKYSIDWRNPLWQK